MSIADVVNRATWRDVAREFALEGWSDEGELAAFSAVADVVRGGSILDLGVGAGRTVALLRLLSSDYVGTDYTPAMVEVARGRHPGVDLRVGDARNLIGFADGSQSLVNFSLNGIDAVDHDDRQLILAEVRRVLQPGGRVVISTLNIDGSLHGCHPGNASTMPWLPGSLARLEKDPPLPPDDGRMGRAVLNWRRLRKLTVTGDGWDVSPMPAHEFGLLTHYVSLQYALAEFRAHGLEPLDVFAASSRQPLPHDFPADAPYFHVTARPTSPRESHT